MAAGSSVPSIAPPAQAGPLVLQGVTVTKHSVDKHDMVWRTLQLLPRGSASWSAGKVCTMHTCAELMEAKLMYT
jgi:hypothetical protein